MFTSRFNYPQSAKSILPAAWFQYIPDCGDRYAGKLTLRSVAGKEESHHEIIQAHWPGDRSLLVCGHGKNA